jgi:hypothetical protein
MFFSFHLMRKVDSGLVLNHISGKINSGWHEGNLFGHRLSGVSGAAPWMFVRKASI